MKFSSYNEQTLSMFTLSYFAISTIMNALRFTLFLSYFMPIFVFSDHGFHTVFGAMGSSDHCKTNDLEVQGCHIEDVTLFQLQPREVGGVETLFDISPGKTYSLVTASVKPPLFEVPSFLTSEECDHLIDLAKQDGLVESRTRRNPKLETQNIRVMDVDLDKKLSINEMMLTLQDSFDIYLSEDDVKNMYSELDMDKNHDGYLSRDELASVRPPMLSQYIQTFSKDNPRRRSRYSEQAWLDPETSKDPVFLQIQQRVQRLIKLPTIMIKKSDFQIVHYGVDGHCNGHHDSAHVDVQLPCCTTTEASKCRLCRVMTVLFYLNDVTEGGGTAFPLAGNETYDPWKFRASHMIDLDRYCDEANLVVKPERGKAVMWYNHVVAKDTGWFGELDEMTWHGGCSVIRGEKWIGNFWIKATEDKMKDLRPID